ncbi:hypothetical protein F5Y11DRAFT_40170 [Daldinia sp. FL1419]|nr:hypothetical protein F5Y11DRAFT_40170 [Daldinia sp. FL1419]
MYVFVFFAECVSGTVMVVVSSGGCNCSGMCCVDNDASSTLTGRRVLKCDCENKDASKAIEFNRRNFYQDVS